MTEMGFKPSVRFLGGTELGYSFSQEVQSDNPLKLIEYAGRWDYGPKSIGKMAPDDLTIIERWIKQGEESMLEMVDAVFFIECSRVVSHELVRHRIASYQQESQRFVAYEDEDEDLFLHDENITDEPHLNFYHETALNYYRRLRQYGVSKQLARYILPGSTRTRLIVKMNLREWRHVLKLRMHSSAQPEMRLIMESIREILFAKYPEVFRDITGEDRFPR